MVLTVNAGLGQIRHVLGGRAAELLDGRGLINQAGEAMCNAHPWNWLQRGPTTLPLRGRVNVPVGATYTDATRTIASAGTFAGYTRVAGDVFTVTTVGSLTGVSANETFGVDSSTSGTLVITTPGLGQDAADSAANNGVADFAGHLAIDWALLPTDFMELTAYDATESLINSLELTDLQHLLELRTNQIEIAAWNFYGAINWFADQTDSNRLKPRLELWPDPPAGTSETLTIFYRSSFPRITDSDSEIQIPEWMEPVFIQWLRAYCKGFEDDADDQPTMSARMRDVKVGDMWVDAVDRDGRIQPDFGPMRGGAVQSMPQGWNKFLRTTVAGPS